MNKVVVVVAAVALAGVSQASFAAGLPAGLPMLKVETLKSFHAVNFKGDVTAFTVLVKQFAGFKFTSDTLPGLNLVPVILKKP